MAEDAIAWVEPQAAMAVKEHRRAAVAALQLLVVRVAMPSPGSYQRQEEKS
jgi:hypothetical protein